jgi:hypothetical protein
MKKLCYFISFLFLLLTFAGCENDGTLNENSEIVVVGLGHKVYNLPLGNEILFTGNDIKWFNRDTREIRFYDHSVFKEKLEQYEKILVILADTELFTATNVSDVMASVSTVYNDLVLYYDTAEDKYYLNDSYRFFSGMNNRSAMYYIETQMIELALRQGDVSLASRMIARTVPDGHVDANMINIRNQYLQHYFEQTGDYRRAYEYLRRDQELNDSIRNEQIRTRVAELDMRYSQDTIVMRRELLIEKQSGEMKVLRLTSYIWAIACVGSIAVLFFLYRLMKKKRAFLQERLLNQISRLRMENIRNHVSPHFTFNVLNREISRFKGTDRERSGLVDLVKLLRKSLEMTEKLSVPLREELDFVQTYIGLERDRLGENFILDLSVDTTLDVEKIIVPSMIVQIPVENAIKHGLAGMEGEKRLEISVMPEGNGVRIMIADNGRGYLPQVMSPTRGTGTGLKVLYQTIQLLNAKNKGEKIRFEITNLADGMRTGTGVSVYIPCNYSYDL